MTKKRILAVFTLVVICCLFGNAVSDSDCGQLEQCVTDPQGNVWCSLFNNASINDLFIMRTIMTYENILSATTDRDVNILWNTHNISLWIPTDYQRATDLDIHVQTLLEGTIDIHVAFYDVRVTGHVLQIGDNKQIVLNCSVTGMHNTSSVVEMRFNDEKSFSCRKTSWPNERGGSIDKPYVRLLDDTTCQLTIPNATKADFVEYYCRVKLQLSPITSRRNCYLLSETIIPSEETANDVMLSSENGLTIQVHVAVIIIVPVLIVVLALLSVLPVVVAIKCWHDKRLHIPQNEQLQEHLNPQGEYELQVIPQNHIELHGGGAGGENNHEDGANGPGREDGGGDGREDNNEDGGGDGDEDDHENGREVGPKHGRAGGADGEDDHENGGQAGLEHDGGAGRAGGENDHENGNEDGGGPGGEDDDEDGKKDDNEDGGGNGEDGDEDGEEDGNEDGGGNGVENNANRQPPPIHEQNDGQGYRERRDDEIQIDSGSGEGIDPVPVNATL